jgi:hypothetical protein
MFPTVQASTSRAIANTPSKRPPTSPAPGTSSGALSDALSDEVLNRTVFKVADPVWAASGAPASRVVSESGPQSTADKLESYRALFEAQKNFPINKEAGLELLSVMARHPETKKHLQEGVLARGYSLWQCTVGVTDADLRASGQAAGSIKYEHNIPTDLLGLLSSIVTSAMRGAGAPALAIPITGAAIQLTTQLVSPEISAENMVVVLPQQVLLRNGHPKGFGAAGNLDKSSISLYQQVRSDGDVESLSSALFKHRNTMRLHTSRLVPMLYENGPRIARSAIVAGGAQAAFTASAKGLGKIPIVLIAQVVGMLVLWRLSATWGGPNQDYRLVRSSIESDLQATLPVKAQELVQRQTGKKLPFGADLSDEVKKVGLDDKAETELKGLYTRNLPLRVGQAANRLAPMRRVALEKLSGILGLTQTQVKKRQDFLDQQAANKPLDADQATELTELEAAYQASLNAASDGVRHEAAQINAEIAAIVQDAAHMKAGPDGWGKIRPQHQEILLAHLSADTRAEQRAIGKAVGHDITQDSFRSLRAHAIQKYAKNMQFAMALSPASLQLVLNVFGILAATGAPIAENTRRAVVAGHWAGTVISELAGGAPLVTDKNTVRKEIQEKYKYETPAFGTRLGFALKNIFFQSFVIPHEAGRLGLAYGVAALAERKIQGLKAASDLEMARRV